MERDVRIRGFMKKADIILVVWTILLLLLSPLAISKRPLLIWPFRHKDSREVSEPKEPASPKLLLAHRHLLGVSLHL